MAESTPVATKPETETEAVQPPSRRRGIVIIVVAVIVVAAIVFWWRSTYSEDTDDAR